MYTQENSRTFGEICAPEIMGTIQKSDKNSFMPIYASVLRGINSQNINSTKLA